MALLVALHRSVLLVLCDAAETHFSGLQQAGRIVKLPNNLQKKLKNLEAAHAWSRHTTQFKCAQFLAEVKAAVGAPQSPPPDSAKRRTISISDDLSRIASDEAAKKAEHDRLEPEARKKADRTAELKRRMAVEAANASGKNAWSLKSGRAQRK